MARQSPIHAQLGIQPQDLTFAHIEAAVAAGMREAADLDWKRALPEKAPEAADEFAKDVAAMANSGGGALVYGVEEQRGAGTAKVRIADVACTGCGLGGHNSRTCPGEHPTCPNCARPTANMNDYFERHNSDYCSPFTSPDCWDWNAAEPV